MITVMNEALFKPISLAHHFGLECQGANGLDLRADLVLCAPVLLPKGL